MYTVYINYVIIIFIVYYISTYILYILYIIVTVHQCAKCIQFDNSQQAASFASSSGVARKPKVVSLDRIDSNKTTATEKSVTLESLGA